MKSKCSYSCLLLKYNLSYLKKMKIKLFYLKNKLVKRETSSTVKNNK